MAEPEVEAARRAEFKRITTRKGSIVALMI